MVRKAVVVAHPDDETLWASSQVEGSDVICCTVPRRDPERAIRFFEAVRVLGGYPILIPFQEPTAAEFIEHLSVLDLSPYDLVVTHNKNGEYGHLHHRQVHTYIKNTYKGDLMTFGYGSGEPIDCDPIKKLEALKKYDNHSNADGGLPKWKALMEKYQIDMDREYFNVEL